MEGIVARSSDTDPWGAGRAAVGERARAAYDAGVCVCANVCVYACMLLCQFVQALYTYSHNARMDARVRGRLFGRLRVGLCVCVCVCERANTVYSPG